MKSIIKIGSNEGLDALFHGLTASMLGVFHVMICFPLYEKMKWYI